MQVERPRHPLQYDAPRPALPARNHGRRGNHINLKQKVFKKTPGETG